ncbi:hypothetical protein NQZ68_018975 [Dissostichus eleginoides]|nr:hypothetical protein NQZ68_018975 [Dissostichus eleginoides]
MWICSLEEEERLKIRKQTEGILFQTQTHAMTLLLSCTEAVTIGVWGHEAGNFSVVV